MAETIEAPKQETPAKPPPPAQRSLVRKLAEVMGEVERVPKSGRNEFHRYDYATEADIAAAVRAGLAKRAVIIIPSVKKTEWETLPSQRGQAQKLCTLTVDFTVEDGDSGETRIVTMVGQGTDSGDKASYKAMTGAEKYALLKLFLIPTGDDPEADDETKPAHGRQSRANAGGDARKPEPKKEAKPVTPCSHEYELKSGICGKCGVKEERPVPKQLPAVRARVVKAWNTARGAGYSGEDFARWAAVVTGKSAPSGEWTADDLDQIEAALPAFTRDVTQSGREVGADG